jgi:hypothetical protein
VLGIVALRFSVRPVKLDWRLIVAYAQDRLFLGGRNGGKSSTGHSHFARRDKAGTL